MLLEIGRAETNNVAGLFSPIVKVNGGNKGPGTSSNAFDKKYVDSTNGVGGSFVLRGNVTHSVTFQYQALSKLTRVSHLTLKKLAKIVLLPTSLLDFHSFTVPISLPNSFELFELQSNARWVDAGALTISAATVLLHDGATLSSGSTMHVTTETLTLNSSATFYSGSIVVTTKTLTLASSASSYSDYLGYDSTSPIGRGCSWNSNKYKSTSGGAHGGKGGTAKDSCSSSQTTYGDPNAPVTPGGGTVLGGKGGGVGPSPRPSAAAVAASCRTGCTASSAPSPGGGPACACTSPAPRRPPAGR